jgi:excisionase family DNA binding protein
MDKSKDQNYLMSVEEMKRYVEENNQDARFRYLIELVGVDQANKHWDLCEATREFAQWTLDADMTTGDVSRYTGLSKSRLRKLCDQGRMPQPRYAGIARWFNRTEIQQWWDESAPQLLK